MLQAARLSSRWSRRLRPLPDGVQIVLAADVALKGCATRTGKPASALDRAAAAKRVAVMPLWRNEHRQQDIG
jgi:hypothetical protein